MGNRIWNSELIPEVTPHWPLFLCAPLQRWPHCKPQTAHCSWAVISKLDFRFQTGSPTICPMSKQMGTTISRILMVNVTKPHTSSLGVSTNLNHPSNYHHIYIYYKYIYIYIYICDFAVSPVCFFYAPILGRASHDSSQSLALDSIVVTSGCSACMGVVIWSCPIPGDPKRNPTCKLDVAG